MGYLKDHLSKLFSLAVIEERGSLRKAATQLRLSQPALTRQMQVLESIVGEKLMTRNSTGAVLTPHARRLSDYAKKILTEIENLEKTFQPKNQIADLRVGTFESLSIRLWPKLMARLKQSDQAPPVSVSAGDTHELYARVKSGELDCAFTLLLPAKKKELQTTLVFKDAYGLFISPAYVFPRSRLPSPANLHQIPLALVQSENCRLGEGLRKSLKRAQFNEHSFFAVETFEAAANYAREGVGIAVLPYVIASPPLKKKEIIALPTRPFPENRFDAHEMGLIARKDSQKEIGLGNLRKVLIDFFSEGLF